MNSEAPIQKDRDFTDENRAFRRSAQKSADSRKQFGVSRLPNRRTTFLRDSAELDREAKDGTE